MESNNGASKLKKTNQNILRVLAQVLIYKNNVLINNVSIKTLAARQIVQSGTDSSLDVTIYVIGLDKTEKKY